MGKIHQLPQNIIAKIAAGEVIERPAYAVKELIENAIDANADYITIHIEEAGLKKIIVIDNGEGMDFEDLQESIKPHTTSKIAAEDDLFRISSLGFRGEALASISSISKMTIKSRIYEKPTGSIMEMLYGKVTKIEQIGGPIGTTVIVDDLFLNVPARKKFLKTPHTEFKHILETIIHYSLAFPSIRFFLTHNKKTVLDLAKNQNIIDRVSLTLGNDVKSSLVPVSDETAYVKITGFITKPQIATYNSSKHFLYVNNRYVTDKSIVNCIKEAYGNLLESKAYPIFILFIQVPFETVDVNVHPRKNQVSFVNNRLVIETVYNAVKNSLKTFNITFNPTRWKHDPLYDTESQNLYSTKSGNMDSFVGKFLKRNVIPWEIRDTEQLLKNTDYLQIHNVYIITQIRNGLLIIDQHAAHERILFEQFTEKFKKNIHEQFVVDQPCIIELSVIEETLLQEYKEQIMAAGFHIEHFQGKSYQVTRIPLLFKDRNIKILMNELLDNLSQNKNRRDFGMKDNRMLSYLACRSAIKAGEKLSKKQCHDLIEKLEQTRNNATCPHARPTKIVLSLRELDRFFKR